MIELFEHKETTYLERANGDLVLGNSKPLKDKGNIEVTIGNETFLIPIGDNGIWRWEAPSTYADGNYSLSISHIDRAGNRSKPTLATIIVDSTPPEAPELLKLYDDFGADIGGFEPGDTTDDKRPTLTGVAQKGTTVYLLNDKGEKIGSAVADKDTGVWKMDPTQDLDNGTNSLRLVAEEKFADVLRIGPPSAPFTIVVGADTPILPPDTITIRDALDDSGTFTGKLSNGALTDDTTPTLRGEVSAGNTVTVYYRLTGSAFWTAGGTATISGSQWSWTSGSALPHGEYEFYASINNGISSVFSLDIATADDIQKKTRIESAYDDFGTWQGPLGSGAITDDTTPTFAGRGEANSKIVLRFMQPGQLSNTLVVDVDSSGKWNWTPATGLPVGNWTFEVQPQGSNNWSESFSLAITRSGDFNPTIVEGLDDFGAPAVLHSNDTTDDTTPTLKGLAEANSMVYLRAATGSNSVVYSLTADSYGKWSWTPPTALAYGSWMFQASQIATGGWGNAFNLNIIASGSLKYSYDFENAGSSTDLPQDGFFVKNKAYKLTEGLEIKKLDGDISLRYTNAAHKFAFGEVNLSLEKNGKVGFIVDNAARFSFQTIGTNGGTISVVVYSTTGSVISNKTTTLPYSSNEVATHNFEGMGQSIGKIDISYSDPYGLYIDNLNWTKSNKAFGISEHEHTYLPKEPTSQLDSYIINSKTSKNETLKVSLEDILQHGKEEIFIASNSKQILIQGKEGDVIQLKDILPENSDISEWKHQDGTVTVAGVEYQVYSHGDNADLLVQQGVKIELI